MQRGAGVHRAPPSSEEFPPQRQQLGRAPGSVFLAAATPGTKPLGRAAPRPQRAALGAGAPGRGRGRAGGDAGEPAVLSRASGPRRGRGGGGGAMARSAEGAALLLLVSAGSGDAEPRGGAGAGEGAGAELAPRPAFLRQSRARRPALLLCAPRWGRAGQAVASSNLQASEKPLGLRRRVGTCLKFCFSGRHAPALAPSLAVIRRCRGPGARSTFPGDRGFVCSLLPPTGNMEAGAAAAVPSCRFGAVLRDPVRGGEPEKPEKRLYP